MTPAVVPISTASDTKLQFVVVGVDFELRLYQDGAEVLGVGKGQKADPHPLRGGSQYYVRYNNNDGGDGFLHFHVREMRTASVIRYTVDIATVSSPEVLDFGFSFRMDSSVAPPA